MEWWSGMNACGTSTVADMNQIDASIFDPWINCDDLDLGSILHQASSSSAATTPSAHSSSSPSVLTSALLTSHQAQQVNSVIASPDGAASGVNGSAVGCTSDSSSNSHLQNYAFICNNNINNNTSNHINHQHHHQQQQQQQQHHHQHHHNQHHQLLHHHHQQQQQHQHHHHHSHQNQQHLSSTTNVSQQIPIANLGDNRQNLFNIISSAAVNVISSHAQQISASTTTTTTNSTSNAGDTNSQSLEHSNDTTTNSNSNNNQTSISSSVSSSSASSAQSSAQSSPVNHQPNIGNSSNNNNNNSSSSLNYLSSSASPSSSSSLILIPGTASLLMVDSDLHQAHPQQHQTQNLASQHRQLQLHHQNALLHHQGAGAGGYNTSDQIQLSERNADSTALHQQQQQQQSLHSQQQQQQQRLMESTIHHQMLTAANQCEVDLVDSKSNLENLLQLANQGNVGDQVSYDSVSSGGSASNRDQFQTHIDNHLIFVCPQQQATSSTSSITTTTNLNRSNGTVSVTGAHQHLRAQLTNSGQSAKNGKASQTGYIVKSLANKSSNSTTSSTTSSTNSTGPKVRRCRQITDYVLAEEEKRLLIKEGYADFPMTCQARPLSKSEERILRKIRRKIRNKKSAQCSRQRKKEYVEDLERKYAAVVRENEDLKQLVARIQQQQQ